MTIFFVILFFPWLLQKWVGANLDFWSVDPLFLWPISLVGGVVVCLSLVDIVLGGEQHDLGRIHTSGLYDTSPVHS